MQSRRLDDEASGPEAGGVIAGVGPVRLWGLEPEERLRRSFRRAKLPPPETAARAAVFRADHVYDEALVKAVAARPGVALMLDGVAVAANVPAQDAGEAADALAAGRRPEAADHDVTAVELVGAYDGALRKRGTPLLMRLSRETLSAVEKRMFSGAYKGVTDVVTKYVWPWPARHVTKWCAQAGLTPNVVTLASLVLTVAAFVLFQQALFGWGLLAAWLMTFLDTVDGKLARVTLTSTKFGNLFDHGIDLISPPFWWLAWWMGLESSGQPSPYAGPALTVVTGGYIVQRLVEGVFVRKFGMHVHVWRRFDSVFRLITARRNPNLVILTGFALAGRPDLGFWIVALWTAFSLGVHVTQLIQGFAAPQPLRSWLEA